MKSRASLFLTVLLLALSLTACGKEPAKNDRNDAGSGQNSAYDAVSDPNRNNAPNNDAIIGRDDNTVTAPDTNPAPNPANDPAGDLPGASMDRMLRNGRVHDRDGDLLDGKRVLLLDDVISTGDSLKALQQLVALFGANIVASAAPLAEGDAADRKDIIFLEKLPLFFK